VIPIDLVGNWPAIAVGARTEAEALFDQPAGERIEFRDPARTRDPATSRAAVDTDGEDHADASSDPCIAEMLRIIADSDFSGDQLKIGAACVFASIALPTGSPAGAIADRGARAGGSS